MSYNLSRHEILKYAVIKHTDDKFLLINVRLSNTGIGAYLFNHCCSRTEINITYCECVFVAFFTHHTMRMRRIILSFCSVRLYHTFHMML